MQTRIRTPEGSECGHSNAGQELCYLCHQRAARNIPVSFDEEKKQREAEEDKVLHDYQIMKNNEFILDQQVGVGVILSLGKITLNWPDYIRDFYWNINCDVIAEITFCLCVVQVKQCIHLIVNLLSHELFGF